MRQSMGPFEQLVENALLAPRAIQSVGRGLDRVLRGMSSFGFSRKSTMGADWPKKAEKLWSRVKGTTLSDAYYQLYLEAVISEDTVRMSQLEKHVDPTMRAAALKARADLAGNDS